MKFNDTGIAKLAPREERYEVSIPGHPLWLVVGTTGKKSWVFRGRLNGKSVRRNLGDFPAIGIVAAQVEAGKLKLGAKAEASNRPVRLQAATGGLTVDEAYVMYMDDEGAKKRTGHELQRLYDKDWKPKVGTTKLRDLTRETIREIVEAKAKTTAVMGNRILSQFGRFLNWCVSKGHLETSPAKGVSKPVNEDELDRNIALPEAQLKILINSIHEAKEYAAPFEFALLSLVRIGNVVNMKWSMIDLDKSIVTFPTTKNKHPHRVPLTDAMKALIPERPADAKAGDKVFPFCKKTKDYYAWRKRWRRESIKIAEKQGLTVEDYDHDADEDKVYEFVGDWRIHDFRGTGTSWLTDDDEDEVYNITVIQAILGHLPKTVAEKNYLKNRFINTRRKAAILWGDYVESLKAPQS